MNTITKVMSVILLIACCCAAAGCQTIQGIGKDIQNGGEALERVTK